MDAVWEVYVSQTKYGPAYISVNSALEANAPLATHPISVNCNLEQLQVDGYKLPTQTARAKVMLFEKKAKALIQNEQSHIYAGRVSLGDFTLFNFYSSNGAALVNAFKTSKEFSTGFQFRCKAEWDGSWEFYRRTLYPNALARNKIENEKIRNVLGSQGDDGSQRRKVNHFAHFPDSVSLDAFYKHITKTGYKVESRSEKPDDNGKWSIVFSDDQAPVVMDIWTFNLRATATKLKGEYSGWESTVVLRRKK